MRESEEYLESTITTVRWDNDSIPEGKWIELKDAKHAVKLAYKEGYLEAIDKIQEISQKVFGDYVPGDVLDFLVEIHKLKNK